MRNALSYADKDTVRLLRFDEEGNRWVELPTNFIDEDNLYLYYSATATEFSYFTVVGQQGFKTPKGKILSFSSFFKQGAEPIHRS